MKYYGNQELSGRHYEGKDDWGSCNRRLDLFKEQERLEDAFKELFEYEKDMM